MSSDALSFETKQSPWWLLLIGGIANVIIGLLLLSNPVKTTVVLVWVLGLYWLIQGIFVLIGMFMDHTAWGWKLFMGIISILAGIVIIRHPVASAMAVPSILILILGIQGLVFGIIGLIMAFKGGGWGAGILGVLSIIFGILLLINWTEPSWVAAFIWAAGFLALIGGGIQIVQSFRQKSENA